LRHPGPVLGVAFGPGHTLRTASTDGTVRVWPVASPTGPPPVSLSHGQGGPPVLALAFDPKGQGLALGARGLAVECRPAAGARPREEEALSAAFGPDGRSLLTGGAGGQARLWDRATGRVLRTFAHEGAVSAVTFRPDGKVVLTASRDRTAALWDAD